ncbi:hypothetical protein NC652_012940 [Populus alba x Populus x berolinensis]|nr:hypothetical protein NC652_012940 [Populus alba x Populus x berolinensis]
MPAVVNSLVLPYFVTNSEAKLRSRVRVQSLGSGRESKIFSSDSIPVKGASIEEKEKNGDLVDGFVRKIEKSDEGLIDGGNGRLKYTSVEKKRVKDVISNDLEVLWDDGYGTKTVRDYLEGAKEIIRPDGGPPGIDVLAWALLCTIKLLGRCLRLGAFTFQCMIEHHSKGEEYKLIWPKQQEFIRMAARFGATIVPFGAVGEDDIAEDNLHSTGSFHNMSSEPKYSLMASDRVSNYYIVSSRFCMGTNLVVLPSRYSLIMQVVLAEPGNLKSQ